MSQEYRPPSAATSRARPWWPVVVPVVWAVVACGVVRPDAIRGRDEVPFALKWLVYDESDLTAFALRGANATAGRLPGRLDEPNGGDPEAPDVLAKRLDAGQPPPAARYYLEYPPASLVLFRLGYWVQGGPPALPPCVADSQQFAVAFYSPRDEAERAIWTKLGVAVRVYVVVTALGLVALIVVLARGYGPELPGGPVWLCVLPGAVFFALNRFDVLPVLATALGFACLGRRRIAWAGAFLAVGVLLKVYPVVFVPIILRYLGPRDGAKWLTSFAAALAVGFGASALDVGWEGATAPIRLQLSRTYTEGNWSLYGYLLPEALAKSSAGRLAILGLAALAAVVTRPPNLASVLRRCALVLVVFAVLAVFWSPQWILWFLPLTVPLANRRPVKAAAVTLDVVNYLSFPILFWIIWSWAHHPDVTPYFPKEVLGALGAGMIFVRGAAWAWLAVALLLDAWREGERAAAGAFHANHAALVAEFLKRAAGQGRPRGVEWVSAEPVGEPVFVRDPKTGGRVALWPLVVTFRPEEGSELEDVPQAREPRTVTAMFTHKDGRWRTTGRAVFNLTPAQVIERGHFGASVEVPHDD